jgi:hypothetical protein
MYAGSGKLLAPKELIDIFMINYLYHVSASMQELVDIGIQRYLLCRGLVDCCICFHI